MESFREIAYEVADGVATVTLDRAERLNAGTNRMVRELVAAVDEVRSFRRPVSPGGGARSPG